MLGTVEKSLNGQGDSKRSKKRLRTQQIRQLEKFGTKVNKFGANFAVCDVEGELVLLCGGGRFKSDSERLVKAGMQALSQSQCEQERHILSTILKSGGDAAGTALIDLGGTTVEGLDTSTIHSTIAPLLDEMLELLAENFQAVTKADEQMEMVSTELAQVYEELVLLHKLSINMKVTEPDANFLQMACDSLTDIVGVEGIAVLLEKTVEEQKQLVLAAGSGLIDIGERMIAILHSRLTEEISSGKEALLDSEIDSPFKYDWPADIKNIIAVPLRGKGKMTTDFAEDPVLHSTRSTQPTSCRQNARWEPQDKRQDSERLIGLMVAINRIDKPDFDSTDVKLFDSVANSCTVFIENGRLFKDLKELFIGSLKALTRSIDAKDQYTRGHSERVAFISRWIAEKLAEEEPLRQEQIHKIYLAGLLHDIGKIGVDEAVLRKKGKLTEQEFGCIKMHLSIGAGILAGIKQMSDIVPGVFCHHERVDGKGYPAGLVGEQIPLIGKIVGLADSFDAMTSKRTYRDAMTVEQAIAEIEKGLGTQFDERVGRAFINSDVYRLWEIIQDEFAEVYGGGDGDSEYGTIAVGSIIR